MAGFWYVAVFIGVVITAMILIGWASGDRIESRMVTKEEYERMSRSHNWWSNLIIIGLLAVIIVFLFVELS